MSFNGKMASKHLFKNETDAINVVRQNLGVVRQKGCGQAEMGVVRQNRGVVAE